jgi:hypothetical protein
VKLRYRLLIGQAVVLVAALALPWMVLSPVPGLLRTTAPVLCPDDQPDASIVEYYGSNSEGSTTSWTLVCMGPRGDITEVGSWRPLAVFLGGFWLLLELLVLPPQLLGALRRRRRALGGPEDLAAGAAWVLDLGRSPEPSPALPPDPSTRVE